MMERPEPVTLFLSYAHEDTLLRQTLEKHLSLLKHQGLISMWHDRQIQPGMDWAQAIDEQIKKASVILLLVSSDFLVSDYCYGVEMKRALQRHKSGEARVIPILMRPVDWKGAPFADLQVLPQNANPVTTWSDQDLAFKDIAIQLRRIVEELREPQRTHVGDENPQLEHVSLHMSQVISKFYHCQKKVNELKSIHNMLHDIEIQLEGLSATIQLITRDEREKKKSSSKLSTIFSKKESDQYLSDFGYIEIVWRQAVLKIDDLAYFAAAVIEALEDEHFSFDSNAIRGAPWIKDLFILQRSFEVGIRDQNIDMVKNLSNELLTKCRSHLYRIDKRLLEAVKELDLSSDLLIRGRA